LAKRAVQIIMARGIEAAIEQHRAGALAQAEALYRSLLEEEPDHPDALRLLGLLKQQTGDAVGAERMIRRSIAVDPANPKSYDNLGCVLVGAGRREEAATCFEEAIALNGDHETAYFNLGKLLAAGNKLQEACHCFQQAIAIDPADDSPRVQLAEVYLKLDQAQAALDQIEALLAQGSRVIQALSLKAIALSELGRDRDLKALVDLEGMVRSATIEDCGGFASLAALNAELAREIAEHPTLREDRTTVAGQDTYELFGGESPSLKTLEGFLRGEIDKRLRDLPKRPGDPFVARRPKNYRLQSWGVKMWNQGYQVPHVHFKAWLSGVYYAQLPAVVDDAAAAHQGWIQFGRATDHFYARSAPPVRLIKPVEGLMITFPSYYWHRTLPFTSERERISIAFDVIPL